MIGGYELQQLYIKKEEVLEEIKYLRECKKFASDIDYWNSIERYEAEICVLEHDLLNIHKEISNYVQ